MKSTIIVYAIFLVGCNEFENVTGLKNPLMVKQKSMRDRSEELGYNPFTDSLVNSVLSNEKIILSHYFQYGGYESFTLRYRTLQFKIYHKAKVPFENIENVEYFVSNERGESIYIQSRLPLHKVHDSTLVKIYTIAKKHFK